jgi:hypothetical protein
VAPRTCFVHFSVVATAGQQSVSACSQGHALPSVSARPHAAGEGALAGATREGGALSEQGAGGGELPQLREGAAGQWQEALLVWHERILAAVLLEAGECQADSGGRGYWRGTAVSMASTSCETFASSPFMSGKIASSKTKESLL